MQTTVSTVAFAVSRVVHAAASWPMTMHLLDRQLLFLTDPHITQVQTLLEPAREHSAYFLERPFRGSFLRRCQPLLGLQRTVRGIAICGRDLHRLRYTHVLPRARRRIKHHSEINPLASGVSRHIRFGLASLCLSSPGPYPRVRLRVGVLLQWTASRPLSPDSLHRFAQRLLPPKIDPRLVRDPIDPL